MTGETFGNYEVVATLGKGGMGVVFLAQHRTIARRVAIKVLAPELTKDPGVVRRFFLEARATSLIRHPGIVEVFDYVIDDSGRAYIVMEYLEGETLAACLQRVGALPWQTACAVGNRIAIAVAAAHNCAIVHRDLKPGNVFLSNVEASSASTERRIKVLDFGLAKLVDDEVRGEPITRSGMLLGTPTYISPEQCSAAAEVDHRTDIYALGCMLFEMICGRPPFEGQGFRSLLAAHMFEPAPRASARVPAIPSWLDELIARMLAKLPADRPASMAEVAAALSAGEGDLEGAGLTLLLAPPSTMGRIPQTVTLVHPATPSMTGRRRRGVRLAQAAAAAGGLVVLVAIAAVTLSRRAASDDRAASPTAQASATKTAMVRDPIILNRAPAAAPADDRLAREPLAARPPIAAIPDADLPTLTGTSEVRPATRRRNSEPIPRRRVELPRRAALSTTDGIVDL